VSDLTGQTRYNQDELISLPSDLPLLRTPTAIKGTRMRLVIDKQPDGTRSPNLADAVVMAYWPVADGLYDSMDWV
jgi:phage terminase large subunit